MDEQIKPVRPVKAKPGPKPTNQETSDEPKKPKVTKPIKTDQSAEIKKLKAENDLLKKSKVVHSQVGPPKPEAIETDPDIGVFNRRTKEHLVNVNGRNRWLSNQQIDQHARNKKTILVFPEGSKFNRPSIEDKPCVNC